MKYLTYSILIVGALVAGVFAYSYEPQFDGVSVITKEYIVGGERVIINEQPPVESRLFGSDISVFKPEVKMEKWGDETYIKVWTDDEVEDTAIQIGDKVISESKDGKREYHLYPLTKEKDGIDGFEYEVILKEKPITNIITLNIDSKGLVFYYQASLDEKYPESTNCTPTDCDTDGDGELNEYRPEDVVGSYAVYHESKTGNYEALGGKNYMVGKAFHIYRPQMIDANDWKVWGELNIDIKNKIQTITIPQDFIDKAVYPIRYASGEIFGYNTEGGSQIDLCKVSFNRSYRVGHTETTDTGGTVDDIRVNIIADDTQADVDTAAFLNEEDSVASGSHGNIVKIERLDVAISTSKVWYTFTANDETLDATTAYVLNAGCKSQDMSGINSVDLSYDDTGSRNVYNEYSTYWPTIRDQDPWTETASAGNNDRYSIYINYTTGGAPAAEDEMYPRAGVIIID